MACQRLSDLTVPENNFQLIPLGSGIQSIKAGLNTNSITVFQLIPLGSGIQSYAVNFWTGYVLCFSWYYLSVASNHPLDIPLLKKGVVFQLIPLGSGIQSNAAEHMVLKNVFQLIPLGSGIQSATPKKIISVPFCFSWYHLAVASNHGLCSEAKKEAEFQLIPLGSGIQLLWKTR